MPSFFSRLRTRRRVASQTTVTAVSSQPPSVQTPTTTPHVDALPPSPAAPPVARKIHPDVNSLLTRYSEEEPVQNTGLTPSTRRNSVDGSSPWRTQMRLSSRPAPPVVVDDTVPEMEEPPSRTMSPSPDSGTSSGKSKLLLHRIAQFSSGSGAEWSTFGRKAEHTSPRISDFGEQVSSFAPFRRSSSKRKKRNSTGSSVHSSTNSPAQSRPSTAHSPVSPSRPTTGPSQPASQPQAPSSGDPSPSRNSSFQNKSNPSRTGSKKSSPSDTISSRSRRTPPTRRRSTTALHSTSHLGTISSGAARDLGFDSPRTFGHPTPPESAAIVFTFGSGIGGGDYSPPPPLPPLNHPALAASLSSGAAGPVAGNGPGRVLPTSKISSAPDTYPRRSSRISHGGTLSNSLPFTFSRSFRRRSRSHAIIPKVQHIFTSENPTTLSQPNTRLISRRKTISGTGLRRRNSADWSAAEATAGVNDREVYSWPAQVSREMLRLSLGEIAGRRSSAGTSGGDKSLFRDGDRTRGSGGQETENVPGGEISTSERSPFFPSSSSVHPIPLIPNLSPTTGSLGSPFAFEGDSNLTGPHDTRHDRSTNRKSSVGVRRELESRMPGPSASDSKLSAKGKERTPTPTAKLPIASMFVGSAGAAAPSSSTLQPPTLAVTAPTPGTSPARPHPDRSISEASELRVPMGTTPIRTPSSSKGKRKAEDVETTPPDQKKETRATFAEPLEARTPRPSGTSGSSAPSSYQRKRARISTSSSPATSPPGSRQGPSSTQNAITAANSGSWSSRATSDTHPPENQNRHSSRAASRAASTRSKTTDERDVSGHRPRPSLSQISIPISALVSPHAPSISRSSTFHMRDPRKPRKVQGTGWALSFKDADNEEYGSPVQAWCFFLGFIIFPVWWVASFLKVPKTRTVGGTDVEKAVVVDDPQVEHDAKSWRLRCRIMSVVSFLTYIPFIVLVAIFVPR